MFSLVTVGFFQILGITVTVTCVWQRLKGIQESGSGKGPSPGILWLEVIGIEKPEVGLTRSSAFCVTDLGIGMAFSGWSWTGSRGKKKNREAGSHPPGPGCCDLIAAKVVAWIPSWKPVGCCRVCGSEFYCPVSCMSWNRLYNIRSLKFNGFKQQLLLIIFHGFSGLGIQKQTGCTALAQVFHESWTWNSVEFQKQLGAGWTSLLFHVTSEFPHVVFPWG